jgi:hypothetical protein
MDDAVAGLAGGAARSGVVADDKKPLSVERCSLAKDGTQVRCVGKRERTIVLRRWWIDGRAWDQTGR